MLNLFSTPVTNPTRLKLVAQGKQKAKKYDFQVLTDSPSLIHYCATYNNLELFKECILKGQSALLQDPWKETPLYYAFKSHSYEVLQYFINEYRVDIISQKDAHGAPLWWKCFTSAGVDYTGKDSFHYFTANEYEQSLSYLAGLGVDFNERETEGFGGNLGYTLLSGYKHKPLTVLLTNQVINVNEVARRDYGYTLAHWGRFMEDSRFQAFDEETDGQTESYIRQCYKLLYTQCNNSILDHRNDSVLDTLCKSGLKHQVTLFCEAKKLSMSVAQRLWFKVRHSRSNVTCDDFTEVKELNRPIIDAMVFFKVTPVGNMLYCDKNALVSGLHDEEISKTECISLKELKEMELVQLPNGTELFQRK